ncbi:MAG: LapA family protein [Marmoricola sp.]
MATDDRFPDQAPTEPAGAEDGTDTVGAAPDRSPASRDSAPHDAAPAGKDPLRGSRAGSTWVALVGVGVLLVLLVIFILQNTQSVQVSFLGFDGTAPLAVCLLIAAAAGILMTALAGTLRILQLRHRVRRETRRARR